MISKVTVIMCEDDAVYYVFKERELEDFIK